MNRKKLYSLLFVVWLAGYCWMMYIIAHPLLLHTKDNSICLLKHLTNIPCPSCGSTRSLMAILNGNLTQGFFLNPLGFILLAGLLSIPFWLSYDLLLKKDTLFVFYQRSEFYLSKKKFAIPAALLIVANWIWNIQKGL